MRETNLTLVFISRSVGVVHFLMRGVGPFQNLGVEVGLLKDEESESDIYGGYLSESDYEKFEELIRSHTFGKFGSRSC